MRQIGQNVEIPLQEINIFSKICLKAVSNYHAPQGNRTLFRFSFFVIFQFCLAFFRFWSFVQIGRNARGWDVTGRHHHQGTRGARQKKRRSKRVPGRWLRWRHDIHWLYAVSCGELRRAKRRHSRVALPGSAAGQNRRRKKLQVAAQRRRARSAYDGAGSHATFPPTILRRDRARAPRRAISAFS